MGNINIASRLVQERHKKGISQEELAAYIGVSKAAVSKWENAQSYPDITFLPQLATYFDISIDELMNYEPQLTREEILRHYFRLAQGFARESFETVYEECQELMRQYYSCYPFLLQLAVLLMNHAGKAKDPMEIMQQVIDILERVQTEGNDVGDAKEAAILQATCYMLMNRNQEALDLLDEDLRPMSQELELLAQVYQRMNQVEKSKKIFQIAMYQHLLLLIGDAVSYMMLYMNDGQRAEEVIERTQQLVTIYHVEELHPNVMANFYISAAQVYAMHHKLNEALDMIEKYTSICREKFFPFQLHGDDYFDQIDEWFADFELGNQAPRSGELITESMVKMVRDNPYFKELHQNPRYEELVGQLDEFQKTFHTT